MDPTQVLQKVFGFKEFRSDQKAIIDSVLSKTDTLVLMPTGQGKSLCYQLPSILLEGLTLVVSPLIALMKDQVDQISHLNIKATFINSSLSPQERQSRYDALKKQKYKLIFVTPERFRKNEFWFALAGNTISLLAVDEAHCISEWGHDFRPDYSRLGEIRKKLGDPPVLALTATATPDVQKDIVKQLRFNEENWNLFSKGLDRPNLSLNVIDVFGTDEKVRSLVGLRHAFPGSTIVYSSLIETLKTFSRELRKLEINHVLYHGQLNPKERKHNQEEFLKGNTELILATPAFGLGVDKPNVRLLVHVEVPGSIEAYYQEVGRAGRDGKPSNCFMLFDQDDISIQMDFIKWSTPDPGFMTAVYRYIKDYSQAIQQEGLDFIREKMNFYNRRDFRVETSVNLLERFGFIEKKGKQYIAKIDPEGEFLDSKIHEKKLKKSQQKLLSIVQFSQLENGCRVQHIRIYFGVEEGERCQICDLCNKDVNI